MMHWSLVEFFLLNDLILGFCYSNLTRETGGFELTSTIIFVLQVNRLNKCASHPSTWRCYAIGNVMFLNSYCMQVG